MTTPTPRTYIGGADNAPDRANTAATDLIAAGHRPINPYRLQPNPHTGECAPGPKRARDAHTTPCLMRARLAALLTCDRLHLLAGWERSEAARTEFDVARTIGLPITYEVLPAAVGSRPLGMTEWQWGIWKGRPA